MWTSVIKPPSVVRDLAVLFDASAISAPRPPYITNVLYSPAPAAQFVGCDVTGSQNASAFAPSRLITATLFLPVGLRRYSRIVLQAVARTVPDLIWSHFNAGVALVSDLGHRKGRRKRGEEFCCVFTTFIFGIIWRELLKLGGPRIFYVVRLIEKGLTSHQTHYRSYRGRFLQVIWPNQQCQSTEGSQLCPE